jgi:two-component system sensor kinase FixL
VQGVALRWRQEQSDTCHILAHRIEIDDQDICSTLSACRPDSVARRGGAFVAIATVAALALEPLLADRPTWLLLTVAVLASAWTCGVSGAGFATLASAISGFLLVKRLFETWTISSMPLACGHFGRIILLTSRLSHWRETAHVHEIDAGENSRKAHETAEELALLVDGATSLAIYMLDEGAGSRSGTRAPSGSRAGRGGDIGALFGHLLSARRRREREARSGLTMPVTTGGSREVVAPAQGWIRFLADVTITRSMMRTGCADMGKWSAHHRRKAAERAIEREAQLNSILATVPDAMVVIDAEGTMLSFSAAAQRMFGYEEAEVLGRNVSMLMPSPDREAHDGYIARFLQTRQAHIIGSTRRVMGCQVGALVPHELAIGEATGGGEQVFTGFMRDLAEEATAAHLKDLQAELIHVSRVSAMGAMASTLAHELNQPITAVVNYVQIAHVLLEDPDPETIAEVRDALADAASGSLRAGQIVRRLRDFVARGEVRSRSRISPS